MNTLPRFGFHQGNKNVSEELLWPKQPRDLADVQKLLDFIDKEILTAEFVQGLDPDVEPELTKVIADYKRTKREIVEAVRIAKGAACAPR